MIGGEGGTASAKSLKTLGGEAGGEGGEGMSKSLKSKRRSGGGIYPPPKGGEGALRAPPPEPLGAAT